MNDLLTQLEQACFELAPTHLVLPGLVGILLGLFLWLGGLRYSHLVIGALGAAVGTMAGWTLSRWLELRVWVGLAGGAVVGAIAAVLLHGVILFVLAAAIFAFLASGAYFTFAVPADHANEWALGDGQGLRADDLGPVDPGDPAATAPPPAESTPERGVTELLDHEDAVARIEQILDDLQALAAENQVMLVLCAIGGGVVGLLLAFVLKKLVMALCCSIVGATAVLAGATAIALAADRPVLSQTHQQPATALAALGGMIIVGWLAQMLTARKPASEKAAADKDKKEDKDGD